MSFADLGLSDQLLRAVTDSGYDVPTPIQKGAIPSVLMGKDLVGIAQTGTGKTASFVLPMIDILAKGRSRARMPRSLILEPTRLEAAEADRSCVACHETLGKPLMRWTCSEHRLEGVSCVACHDPNAAIGKTLRQEDPALCLRCHPDVGAEFRLPSRHPVEPGRMRCSDCHDPHGNEAGVHRFDLSRRSCAGA